MMDETYQFALVLEELPGELHRVEDALFEAGCDDALLVFRGPIPVLEFDREGSSFQAAVLSAMRDVAGSGIGATVLRIEPDDLVSAAEIARRASVSREAVRLWTTGKRREGFAPSRARVGKSEVWSWREVALWLHRHGEIDDDALARADALAGLNLALDLHRAKRTPVVWSSTEELLAQADLLEAAVRG